MPKPSESSRWIRLFGEGVMIVLSILLAFWIDASWDTRQARVEEFEILASLDQETDRNVASLYSGLMARAAAPAAAEGQDLVFNVAARLGPAILGRLRTDDEFIGAVMNKAALQTTYLGPWEDMPDA